MRVVAMVSGGKDSCYNMMQCVAEGHQIVALANLHPKDKDELDSYMYQTVGHMGIEILAKAMELPLYRRETCGRSSQTGKHYIPTDDSDEVEDLYSLLKSVKEDLAVDAVAVGAILSDYQRVRVENVCGRLNLISLAYLWRRDQTELLQEMIDCHVTAIIIKVAALGLVPEKHLGKSLREVQPHLIKMCEKYGLNVCGEGGEYETFTLDSPLFKRRIVIEDMQIIISSADPVCPVGYINFTKLSLQDKNQTYSIESIVKKSLDYITDLNESTYSDLSDPDLSESELELIEKGSRMRGSLSHELITSRSNSISHHNHHHHHHHHHHPKASSPIQIVTKSSSLEDSTVGLSPPQPSPVSICVPFVPVALNSSEKYLRESKAIDNQPMSVRNSKGWMWLAGIEGCGETVVSGTLNALSKLNELALQNDYKLSNFCYVTLYVGNILEYQTLNGIYLKTFNFQNPPTRVCVECPLPEGCHVIIEAVAYKSPREANDLEINKRHTMHVQGISHWAPANIGPYSQSTRIGEITYVSGQIALVPGSMTIIDGGIKPQCKLALRHISRIMKAMNAHGQLRDVVQGICFVTSPSFVTEARRQWERRTTNAIMDYIVVPALPREALVEWQVWSHTHNDKFDYEETGCSVREFTISSRRRWNYENNCAAIVCYVSTGLATSTTQLTQLTEDLLLRHKTLAQSLNSENFEEILNYTLLKLLKDYPKKAEISDTLNEKRRMSRTLSSTNQDDAQHIPAIHLKIFYQVDAINGAGPLIKTLQAFKSQKSDVANIAYTVLPACTLHNFSTFISICGIRHE